MINLSRDGYAHEQIVDMLHGKSGTRQVRFRYFLLDKDENEKGELHNIENGSVSMSAFSDLKRTAKLTMKEYDLDIDWYSDRIQIFIEFKMPDTLVRESVSDEYFVTPVFLADDEEFTYTKKEGGWVAFSLGIFLISSPNRTENPNHVYRDIEMYDKLLILQEDKVTDRFTINAGTTYYQAMIDVMQSAGINKINIENNDKTLPNAKEWEPGTPKLSIINELASDLGFTQIWVDEYGYFRTSQYQSPQDKPTDYEYKDDDLSITLDGMEEELDLFDIPNVFTVVVSNPDNDTVLTSTVENNNPNHPRSIPSLGRQVVRFEEKYDIADQSSLDAYTERIASETSQVYGKVKFSTAIMPFHSYSNVLRIANDNLGINDKYAETSWTIPLQAGADMTHEVRKVVSLS